MIYFDGPILDEEYSDLNFGVTNESSEFWSNHPLNHGHSLPCAYSCFGKWKYNAPDEFKLNNIELMQFTGLEDKNGKEIYDKDIVKIHYFKSIAGENLGVSEVDAELIGVIEITPLSLILKNIIGEKWCEYTGYEQGEGECKVFHLHDVYEGSSDAEYQIEIIGNIYENPELLN